jgi:hypothetical protein
VEGVVPHPHVAPLLQEHFVAFAADADGDEQEVVALAMKLEGAMMLPFVIFTDAQGNYLDGYSGTTTPPFFLKTIQKLIGDQA